jgi:hypothetical protein
MAYVPYAVRAKDSIVAILNLTTPYVCCAV